MLIVHLVSSDRTKWSHVHTHLIFPVTVEKNITIIVHLINEEQGFPVGSVVKNLPGLQIAECRRPSVRLWVRKVPRRREWQPTPVFLPGEFHGQSRLACYSPWGCKESDMAEWLTRSLYRWENWSKERWRNLSRATSWLWIHTMGFRYHTHNLYTYWPEIELVFTVSLRMLKSVFFSLSLPGNLRSPVLAC